MKQKLLSSLARPVLRLCSVLGFTFLLLPGSSHAQTCFPTGIDGTVFNYVCPQTCSDLNLQIPHIKSSSDYRVVGIPHTPFPWTAPGGVELVALYADDLYSDTIDIPFTFCFYGSFYNSCIIGSNGIITFDLSTAHTANSWSLTTVPHGPTPQPIPFAGGFPNNVASTYYPPASIMGAYHDIFPFASAGGQRKIEYAVIGTAPCRKFVVSYYLVPLYGSATCNGRLCTQQIVLHESTGYIDVHLGDKPVCNEWNGGLAILGVQNWNRDAAVAATGKNCTVWNETGTSYRFIPSGAGSRFVRSEIYTLGGALVDVADTMTTTVGMLDLEFLNICPPAGTTRYEVRTTFASCSDPSTLFTNSDTITTITDNELNATASATNSACGPPSGTITVTVPPGAGTPPFTYILDGGAPVIGGYSHTFTNVLHGPHTVDVIDANGGCNSNFNITVGRNNALLASTSSTATYCPGSASGTVTATVTNGVAPPYTYTLNGGAAFFTGGTTHTFTGLSAGTHTIVVADATGCMTNVLSIEVFDGPGVIGNYLTTATSCPSVPNGTIRVTVTAGLAPFSYRLDGGPPQGGGNSCTFSNVSAGAHTVLVTDNAGCTLTLNMSVPSGPALTASNTAFPTSCNGAADGRIRVTPLSGVAPYTFSLDGGAPVAGVAPYTFTNLTPTIHTIRVIDATGCSSGIYSVTVDPGPPLSSTVIKTDVACNGDASGMIIVNVPSGGLAPYEYSLDGSNWQSSRTFSGLLANTYTVWFRSSNGCTGNLNVTITEPAQLTSSFVSSPVVCNGESNGVINITAAGGVSPYAYSIDGGASWQGSGIFNVAAGLHTITIRDANGCITSGNISITEPAVLTATAGNSNATCDGGYDGVLTVLAAGGNGNYLYSIDGSSYQASRVFFVAPGNYTVYVRDNKGCNFSFGTSIGLTFDLFLDPMADPTICEGSSTRLQPSSNAKVYTWSPSTALDNPNIASPRANPTDSTWYYLVAELGRCTLMDTIRLNVIKAPIPDAGPDGDICYGQSYTLQGTGGTEFNWTPAIYLSSTTGANPVSTPTVNATYTLSIKDIHGCPSLVTDQVSVVVKGIMAVHTFPFDTIVAPGERFQLLAVSKGITYNWNPATALSDPGIANPYVTAGTGIGDEISYQVIATNSDGCKGEGYVRIKVHKGPAIYVPTAFTPNGDGKNETFTPHPVGIKSYNYFRVFNRWGQLLFSTTRLHHGWDGRIGGVDQPPGTYAWMVEGITDDNKLISKKGTVTLLR